MFNLSISFFEASLDLQKYKSSIAISYDKLSFPDPTISTVHLGLVWNIY